MNLFAELREGFGISWDAIRANKLRSILTTLGIVIGIVTVTLMGTAIEGLNRAFLQSVSALGADVFYVEKSNWLVDNNLDWQKIQKRRIVRIADAEQLANQLTFADAVAPCSGLQVPVRFRNRSSNGVYVLGTTDEYLRASGVGVEEGRFLSPIDAAAGRPVCVIGTQVATNLFPRGTALGNKVKIGSQSFEVIGVLERQGSFLGLFSLDNRVIIPLKQLVSGFRKNPEIQVMVKARAFVSLEDAREEIRAAMRRVRRLAPDQPDDFAINQQDQLVAMFYRMTGTIAVIGLLITSLSLFVGGIGIMNIMFVSVTERTREIGIRKAIGAKRRTILLQFLIEAACICVLGGLIGLSIAWPLTLGIKRFMPTSLSLPIVAMALLVSFVTGVIAGFLPAWRAARMDPVDALRSE